MNQQIEPRRPIPAAPIHPLAALATVALDGIFGVFEIVTPIFIVLTSLVVFALGLAATAMIQHYLARERWGIAIAKGLAMGIIAGVPYPVIGTALGAPLLVWAGLHEWIRLPPAKKNEENPPDVVDGDYHDL